MDFKTFFRDLFSDGYIEDKFFAYTNPLFWVYMALVVVWASVKVIIIEEGREWWFVLVKVHFIDLSKHNWQNPVPGLKPRTKYERFKKRVFMRTVAKRLSTKN